MIAGYQMVARGKSGLQ